MAGSNTVLSWYEIPNDVILIATMMIALFISGLIIRAVYMYTPTAGPYSDVHTYVAVKGLKVLKLWTIMPIILTCALVARSTIPTETHMLNPDSSNKGLWCIGRFGIGIIIAFTVYLFDSHPFFRWICSLGFPIMVMGDMVSQNAFIRDMWCMTKEVCPMDEKAFFLATIWAWRDIASMLVLYVAAGLSIWLLSLHGACSNNVYFPRLEHRRMTKKLDEIVGKGRRKVVRSIKYRSVH